MLFDDAFVAFFDPLIPFVRVAIILGLSVTTKIRFECLKAQSGKVSTEV
jgi:hypothetical protein